MPKLITEPMDFTGLDPQIAEELRKGNKVWGRAWNRCEIEYREVFLIYYKPDMTYPFLVWLDSGLCDTFKHFTPIYKQETDWSKVKRDEKIVVKDENYIFHYYFAEYNKEENLILVYVGGRTSWTANSLIKYNPSQCRLAEEGE